jgi:hypothetical protein
VLSLLTIFGLLHDVVVVSGQEKESIFAHKGSTIKLGSEVIVQIVIAKNSTPILSALIADSDSVRWTPRPPYVVAS